MRPPFEIDRDACPAILPFEFRNLGNLPLLRARRIARKDPNQAVPNLNWISRDFERRHRPAKQFVRDLNDAAVFVVRPAVIGADEIAAVNIAARISALSAPGEVLVSRTVADLARTSAGVTFEDRGEHALKGVGEPVRVFGVRASET